MRNHLNWFGKSKLLTHYQIFATKLQIDMCLFGQYNQGILSIIQKNALFQGLPFGKQANWQICVRISIGKVN